MFMSRNGFSLVLIWMIWISMVASEGGIDASDGPPMKKAERPKLKPKKTLPPVTDKVFMEIQIGKKKIGKIVFGLFGTVAPKAVENFKSLCLCNKGNGKISGSPLCYKGTTFHRIIPNFMIQGGDISNGKGGESIYGGFFEDESFEVKYNTVYLLSMANRGYRNTNGSQFFINTVKSSWLDKKHAAIGVVLKGKNIVDKIGTLGRRNGKPKEVVTIYNSGELQPAKDSMKN